MANAETSPSEEELSKKDRIINAWSAVGYEAKASDIAEVTDSSLGYASRIQTEMEEGEISEDEVEEIRNEQLIQEYGDRLGQEQGDNQEETSTETAGTAEDGEQQEQTSPKSGGPQQETAQQTVQQHQQPSQQSHSQLGQQQMPTQGQHPPHQAQRPPGQQYQRPPEQQSPTQQLTQHQQGLQELPTGGEQTVSIERLRELDQLLATYEEEAQYELQNLPQQYTAEAVGKLFVAQKTRTLLREITGSDSERQS